MAYDSATGSVVLFGGANGGSDLNDTWTFNGVTWTRLSPSTSPPARAYASMAYDPATGKIVLFGGSGNSGDLSDTWTFDGTNWTELSTTASPPARDSASFAYDAATGKIVLFGGEGNGGNLGDTWTFDGTNWTQLSPPASPPVGIPPWPTTQPPIRQRWRPQRHVDLRRYDLDRALHRHAPACPRQRIDCLRPDHGSPHHVRRGGQQRRLE
jgi:hypothetical protein